MRYRGWSENTFRRKYSLDNGKCSDFRRTNSYGDVTSLSFLDKRFVCNMNKAPDIESVCPELDRSIRGPKKPDVKLAASCSRRSLRPLSKTMPRVSITHVLTISFNSTVTKYPIRRNIIQNEIRYNFFTSYLTLSLLNH